MHAKTQSTPALAHGQFFKQRELFLHLQNVSFVVAGYDTFCFIIGSSLLSFSTYRPYFSSGRRIGLQNVACHGQAYLTETSQHMKPE